jgi:phospholipid/cholesterol/gamma-HCH transport system substrate-binding protein
VGIVNADSGLAGTQTEQQVIAALLDRDGSAQSTTVTALLAGPLLRGTEVSQQ